MAPEQAPTPQRPSPTSILLGWYANNPLWGLIGSIASVMSLGLAIFLYWISIERRDLILYVNPTRATILKNGQLSDLQVLYKGKAVWTDISVVKVGLWNGGKKSIKGTDILAPITLKTTPRVPILQATLDYVNRDKVVFPFLNTSKMAQGEVGISWKILEHNDGIVVEFDIAGPTNVTIDVSGVLEGQNQITSWSDPWPRSKKLLVLVPIGFLIGWFCGILRSKWRLRARTLIAVFVLAIFAFSTAVEKIADHPTVPLRFDTPPIPPPPPDGIKVSVQ